MSVCFTGLRSAFVTAIGAAMTAACAQTDPVTLSETDGAQIEGARWHHVHINTVDAAASAGYYDKFFDADAASFSGADAAVKSGDSWILFEEVETAAPTDLITPIWHIGFGATNPQAEERRQIELGNTIQSPLRELVGGVTGYKPGEFYFMYVQSPDGTLIELNTAPTDQFGHIHLYSANPFAAAAWYCRYFGV
ncbi:MAG: hypothetical protein CMK07_09795, partial [Ponticaulis sp.]|nr:hypothetical protein [Ponticaulis sp.]